VNFIKRKKKKNKDKIIIINLKFKKIRLIIEKKVNKEMKWFQKFKAKKVAKMEETLKNLRERDPMEEIEMYIKLLESYLETWKFITPSGDRVIKDIESQLKKLYQKQADLEALRKN
ncbi:MAG: hypothetical protein ACFE9T_10615, partial [Promethearchaeota archaeon]